MLYATSKDCMQKLTADVLNGKTRKCTATQLFSACLCRGLCAYKVTSMSAGYYFKANPSETLTEPSPVQGALQT